MPSEEADRAESSGDCAKASFLAGTETLNSSGVSSETFQTTTPVCKPETKAFAMAKA